MTAKLYDSTYLNQLENVFAKTKQRSYELLNARANEIIADIGCGTGTDTIKLAQTGAKVYGIDNDINFLSLAKAKVVNENVEFLCCDADSIPLADNTFDKVRFDRVLQHISDHDKVLQETYRLLKPNGQLQIVDTDYLSLSLFLEDEKFERKIIDTIAYERISNGHKVRQFSTKLERNNFHLISVEVHNYIINNYNLAKSIIHFDKTITFLIERKQINEQELQQWKRHTKNNFNLSINLMLFLAEKQES